MVVDNVGKISVKQLQMLPSRRFPTFTMNDPKAANYTKPSFISTTQPRHAIADAVDKDPVNYFCIARTPVLGN